MIKVRSIRVLSALLVILIVILGAACKTGHGTICSFGAWGILFACPLGSLQMALASRDPLPSMWLPVGLTLLTIVVLGRFFCGWICPTALLRETFKGRGASKSRKGKHTAAVPAAIQPGASSPPNPGGLARLPPHRTMAWASYSRYAVLGGALISSFLFGFPVFCLVCPVGLFFSTVFAVSRLFISQQPSLELLLFPAVLGLELLVLKNWCRTICPLGALLSIVSRLNPFLRPAVEREVCLTSQGINCRACLRACPEGIHLPDATDGLAPYDCTKCLECYERCPTKAIRIGLLGKLPGGARAIKWTQFKKVE